MEISFIASIPMIQSAVLIGGDGATRIKLDIPESEIAEAIKLVLLKGQSFKVIITNDVNVKPREYQEVSQDTPKLPCKSATTKERRKIPQSKRKTS